MRESPFALHILSKSYTDIGATCDREIAWPKLKALATSSTSYTIALDDVETYSWPDQTITLTAAASARLLSEVAHSDEERRFPGQALAYRLFVVSLAETAVYGGLFLFPMTPLRLDYPVIYVDVVGERVRLHLRPIQSVLGYSACAADWNGIKDTRIKIVMADAGRLIDGPSILNGPTHKDCLARLDEKARENWAPGSYEGLAVGKSTRSDVLAQFGHPEGSSGPKDGSVRNDDTLRLEYVGIAGSRRAVFVIERRTELVTRIEIWPDGWDMGTVVRAFGMPPTSMKPPDKGLVIPGPACLVYPERGLYVRLDPLRSVVDITYTGKPSHRGPPGAP